MSFMQPDSLMVCKFRFGSTELGITESILALGCLFSPSLLFAYKWRSHQEIHNRCFKILTFLKMYADFILATPTSFSPGNKARKGQQ